MCIRDSCYTGSRWYSVLNEEQKERLARALIAEIPCVPLVRLMCVRVAFSFLVFCGSLRCYCRWIYYRSLFYDQSFCCELLYHLWKKLFLQLVFWNGSLFLQRLCLSFIDHHNILAVTAVSFFCILPEKIRSPAWTAVRRIFHHRNRSLLLSHKCSWRCV